MKRSSLARLAQAGMSGSQAGGIQSVLKLGETIEWRAPTQEHFSLSGAFSVGLSKHRKAIVDIVVVAFVIDKNMPLYG